MPNTIDIPDENDVYPDEVFEVDVEVEPLGTLWNRLARVRRQLGSFSKAGHNKSQNYSYISYEQIMQRLQPLLVEQEIWLAPALVTADTNQVRDGITKYTAAFEFTWLCPETGEKAGPYLWPGEGEDKGDKGANKAGTAATKYFLLKFFGIPVDEPDPDGGHEEADHPTTSQPVVQPASTDGMAAQPAQQVMVTGLKEKDECPICKKSGFKSNKDYPAALWPNRRGPGLQCNGVDHEGRYQNHTFA